MYQKPTLYKTEDLSEGVYAASGSGCYKVTYRIHQRPETGRGDYRIQIDAVHNADHTRESQTLTISFNQPVTYKSSQGTLKSGSGTSTLVIGLNYHQNPHDNIGFGDLVVESDPGLAVMSAKMTD